MSSTRNATSARRDGEDWVLNGTKRFITNAPSADVFMVYARTDPDWVRSYVASRGDLLAGLSRREALKHL